MRTAARRLVYRRGRCAARAVGCQSRVDLSQRFPGSETRRRQPRIRLFSVARLTENVLLQLLRQATEVFRFLGEASRMRACVVHFRQYGALRRLGQCNLADESARALSGCLARMPASDVDTLRRTSVQFQI